MTSLPALLTDYVITNGPDAKAKLAEDSDLSVSLILKAKSGKSVRPETAYRLAIALGQTERDAKKIAETYLSSKARRSLKAG